MDPPPPHEQGGSPDPKPPTPPALQPTWPVVRDLPPFPTPDPTATGGSSSGLRSPGKRKRELHSSEESALSSIDTRDPLRKTYPILHPLPLYDWPIPPGTEEAINWISVRPVVLAIVHKRLTQEITAAHLSFRRSVPVPAYSSELEPSTDGRLTFVVITKADPFSDSWYLALREIAEYLNGKEITGLAIEFYDPVLDLPIREFNVDENDRIVSAWPRVEPQITLLLHVFPYATLSVVRRGRSEERLENLITVLIGAPEDTRTSWGTIQDQIRVLLAKEDLINVDVTLIAINSPFAIDALDDPSEVKASLELFERNVEMGASFAPVEEKTAATIGGTVQLTMPNGHVSNLLLTNFRPFRRLVNDDVVKHGSNPASTKRIPVEIPPTMDANNQRDLYQQHLDRAKARLEGYETRLMMGDGRAQKPFDNETAQIKFYQTALDKMSGFPRAAGTLWACSGFDRMIDWALIESRDRTVENLLPSSSQLRSKNGQFGVNLDERHKVRNIRTESIEVDLEVLKHGRTTSTTFGKLNCIKTVLVFDKYHFRSWHILSPDGGVFTSPGDSGSFIIDMSGDWVGLLYARTGLAGLMITVDELIEDIERTTGGKVQLPQ